MLAGATQSNRVHARTFRIAKRQVRDNVKPDEGLTKPKAIPKVTDARKPKGIPKVTDASWSEATDARVP